MNEIETIQAFPERLIKAQKPVRILESVRWTDEIRDQFLNAGDLDLIPLIFCGKTALADIGHLRQLSGQGMLSRPAFVPPQFVDLHGLVA